MDSQQLHLVTHVLCPYVQRSVIVLQEKGIPYKRTDIDLANTPAWFKQISPLGKVPVLLVNKSRSLFESAIICEYLDEITPGSLHPEDPLEKAQHRAWIEFGSGILNSIGSLYNAKDEKSFENKRIELQHKFQFVEEEIYEVPYFSGDKFQLIDVVYGPIFRYFDVFDRIVDLGIFDNLPKIKVWRNALQQRASIQLAVATEYPELLLRFLREQNSYISRLE
jgi:glutathione S-transferase